MDVWGSPRRWDRGSWGEQQIIYRPGLENSFRGTLRLDCHAQTGVLVSIPRPRVTSLVVNMETKFSGSSKTACPPSPCFKHKGLLPSRGSENPVNSLLLFLWPGCRRCIYNPPLTDINYLRLWIQIDFSPQTWHLELDVLFLGCCDSNHEIPEHGAWRFHGD